MLAAVYHAIMNVLLIMATIQIGDDNEQRSEKYSYSSRN